MSTTDNHDHQNHTVLVTGGAGYIGSQLCRELLKNGYTVRVLDTLLYGDAGIRDLVGLPGFQFICEECRDTDAVEKAVEGAESVVHLAAIVGDPACDSDRREAIEVNYTATRILLHAAKRHNVHRFIFASSCSTYGASEGLTDEHSPLNPLSVYALSKVAAEQAVLQAATAEFHPIALRFATVFGLSYRSRFDLVVNLLAANAYYKGLITIFNGRQWRPLIHVRDVARAIHHFLVAPTEHASGEIFNVGSDQMNYTLSDIGELILRRFPGTHVEHIENPDHRDYRVSFEKVRTRVGFDCSIAVEDGIDELRAAFERGSVPAFDDPRCHNHKIVRVHRPVSAQSGASRPRSAAEESQRMAAPV